MNLRKPLRRLRIKIKKTQRMNMNLKEDTLSLMHLMKENMMIIMKDKRTVKCLTIKKNQIETKEGV